MQYLVKSISRVFEGKKLVGSARYLERTQEILTQSPLSVSSASDYVLAPPSRYRCWVSREGTDP